MRDLGLGLDNDASLTSLTLLPFPNCLLLPGVARAEIARELPCERGYRLVEARPIDDAFCDPIDAHDHYRRLILLCDRLAEVIEQGGSQLRDLVRSCDAPGACADAVAAA